jgi:hypothetical protein
MPVRHGDVRFSGPLSRRLDELQFTFGEGPCLDAVASGRPVLAYDMSDRGEWRWPAFTQAVSDSGVQAVFALPVSIARKPVGALDLFRSQPGPLSDLGLDGGLWAAELAALPLLDLMTADVDWSTAGEGRLDRRAGHRPREASSAHRAETGSGRTDVKHRAQPLRAVEVTPP